MIETLRPSHTPGETPSSKRICFEFRNHSRMQYFVDAPMAKLSADNNSFDLKVGLRPLFVES
jgi:hypothetical protein